MNEAIDAPQLRLIGHDGTQLGVVVREQAFFLAHDSGLDLVQLSESATPPVVKLMDFKKYQYEEVKRVRHQRAKQRGGDVKEIKLSYKIDEHDFQTKLRKAQKMLAEGDRVKVYIQLRGRENIFAEQAKGHIQRFVGGLGGHIESMSQQRNRITAILK
ncbi:translation initiation factor IF-3 [Candidatus Berkelbacteria bacterium]|nr:translation initiation factor IF-3 [Candidatus Berkelbacteria bacterium]